MKVFRLLTVTLAVLCVLSAVLAFAIPLVSSKKQETYKSRAGELAEVGAPSAEVEEMYALKQKWGRFDETFQPVAVLAFLGSAVGLLMMTLYRVARRKK